MNKYLFVSMFLMFLASCGGIGNKHNNIDQVVKVDARDYKDDFTYRLGAGDKLKVTIYQEKDLSGEFEVDSKGFISMPYIQEVKADKRTVKQLTEQIAKLFIDQEILRDPRVSAEVLNYRPFYIHGEVNEGGEFPYKSNMDVKKAVATAGGYSYRANQDYAYIRREGSDSLMRVDISNSDFPVYPGDNIEIPERFF